jgi:hypothetical protein
LTPWRVRGDRGGQDHPVVTAAAVIGVAVVAAVVSYEHAYALVRAHGESGWTAHLIQEAQGAPRARAGAGGGHRTW